MLAVGDEIDAWVVEQAIGRGGMGSVYRCHNKRAKRILAAVKTLDPSVRKIRGMEDRFVREAEILFSLNHPNVVKVRNIRFDVEVPYIEMEFVEGQSLEDRMSRGAVPLQEAVHLMDQVLDAVTYLHGRGVRHRDLKPGNILIDTKGAIRIVDFGLAYEADVSRITAVNMKFGTVAYSPPEWISPETMDPASWDIYACGVMFWEMLTGKAAFPSSGNVDPQQQAVQIMTRKQNHLPLDPGAQFPEVLRSLVAEMAHADKEKRVASARDALVRLRGLRVELGLGELPVADLSSPTGDQAVRRKSTGSGSMPPTMSLTPSGPDGRPLRSKDTWVDHSTHDGVGSRTSPLVIGASVVLVLVAVVGAGALASGLLTGPSTTDVLVSGLSRGTGVALQVDGKPALAVKGFQYTFDGVDPKGFGVDWAAGTDCTVEAGCPGASCPAWCLQGTDVVAVDPVLGVATLELAAPAQRTVRLDMAGFEGDWPLAGDLSGKKGVATGSSLRVDAVDPGPYVLTAELGACPPEAAGCDAAGTCPAGCRSYRDVEFIVPAGDGDFAMALRLTTPEVIAVAVNPEPGPGAPSVVAASPSTAPASVEPKSFVRTSSGAVSRADFAGWLATHPEWTREAAIAAGKADSGYLKGWDGASPPAGGGKMVNVSWLAAKAFCAGYGGLAAADASPLEWSESASQPYQEWRSRDGGPAWRREDGAESEAEPEETESNAFTGFRCAK